MKSTLKTQVVCVAGLALALSMTVGCRSNKGQQPKKTTKLTLLSDRECIPPPYLNPASNRRSLRPAVQPSEVAGPQQPALIAPAEPAFIPASVPVPMDVAVPPTSPAPAVQPVSPAPAVDVASVPAPGESVPVPPARTYKVKRGDTLSDIAYMYRIRWPELAAENKLTGQSVLKEGQVLRLPAGAAAEPRERQVRKAGTVKTAPEKQPAVSAASKTSSRPAAPKAVVGNTIPADGFYSIQAGDNIWKLARRFKIKEADLKSYNPEIANFNTLKIGQRIRLRPFDGISVAPAAAPKAVTPVAAPEAAPVAAPVVAPTLPGLTVEPVPVAAPVVEAPVVPEAPVNPYNNPAPALEPEAAAPAQPVIPALP